MRVLIVPSWYVTAENGFSGIFFKELAEELASQGAEVALLYFDIKRGIKSHKGLNYAVTNGVKEFIYRQKNFTPGIAKGVELQKYFRLNEMSREILNRFGKPDIIHLESCDMINIAMKLRKKWNAPLVYTEHLSNILRGDDNGHYMKKFRKAVRNCDGCIAISSAFERKMIEESPGKLFRIPNGVKPDCIGQLANQDVFHIKALGALREIKGYDTLIKAFGEFSKDKEDVRLTIGGSGSEKDKLQSLLEQYYLGEKAKLIGHIRRCDVNRFYSDCTLFVCSSRTETFSIVTAEALCNGIPVVATKCGGPEDMVNESNGVLVDVGDQQQMAKAFEHFYKNLNDYKNSDISQAALTMYNFANVADKHIECYREVINGFEK